MTKAEELLREARKRLDHPVTCYAYATGGECNCGVAVLLARIDACLSAAPSGWVMVPREPTSEMIDAGAATPKMLIVKSYVSTAQLRGGFVEEQLAGPKSDCAIAQCYRAMLAAAGEGK